jgi:hypothetical protein
MSPLAEFEFDDVSARDHQTLGGSFDPVCALLQLRIDRCERRTLQGPSFADCAVDVRGVCVIGDEVDLTSDVGARGAKDECTDVTTDVKDDTAVPTWGKYRLAHVVAIPAVTL